MGNIRNATVADKFQTFPKEIRLKLLHLRKLIIDVSDETTDIGALEETLKWGEPSYLAEGGSTVRLGWKASRPEHYAMYFNCQTKLVDTFKELYADLFRFESNRAIVFHHDDTIATQQLKHCIALSLSYHKLKHLPLLGA